MPGGLKYNNPGNLRYFATSAAFNGEIRPNSNQVWREFIDLDHGIRAIFVTLTTMYNQGKTTLRKIFHEYAPYGDGANNPDSYATHVGQFAGVNPDAIVNLRDPMTFGRIVYKIIAIEQGMEPDADDVFRGYSLYTQNATQPNVPAGSGSGAGFIVSGGATGAAGATGGYSAASGMPGTTPGYNTNYPLVHYAAFQSQQRNTGKILLGVSLASLAVFAGYKILNRD